MQKNTYFHPILICLAFTLLCSCQHEIDFDYPTSEMLVIIEGQVSNEGTSVRISHSRELADNTDDHIISDAQVWLSSDDGFEEQLVFDEKERCYLSPSQLTGIPGHTYKMKAIVGGHTYESTSTMQPPCEIDTVYFRKIEALDICMYFYYAKGKDAIQNDRNYYLCRLMRGDELFRWNTRSSRSSVNNTFEYDMICSSEKDMEEGIDDDGKRPLMEGDTLSIEVISLDRPTWKYFHSLTISGRSAANPITNITGGAQGVFMAANIVRPDPIVFIKELAQQE
jgi:hypothetical protein